MIEMLLHHDPKQQRIMRIAQRDHEGARGRPRGSGAGRTASAWAAEAWLQDLSGGAPGQCGHDRDLARILEDGEPLPAVEDELVGPRDGAGPEGDEGRDLLAEVGVRHPDDRRLDDGRVREEHGFHLLGEDRVAAAQDPLAFAPDDLYLATGRHRREVPRPEPAVAVQDFVRLVSIVQVALHRGGTLDPELADGTRGERTTRVVHDPRLDPGDRAP